MTTVINGLLGGLLAGLLAAVATVLVDTESPAASKLVGTAAGRDSPPSPWLVFLIQGLYGSIAGGSLLVLELYVLGILAVPPTVAEAFGVAAGWSALLFVAVVAVGRAVSALAFDRSHLGEILVYHLVYGLALGVWIRVTWIT